MDASRFDALARSVASRPSRRRFLRFAAVAGLVATVTRPAARAAARASEKMQCPRGTCPSGQCWTCYVDRTENSTSCQCLCETYNLSGIAGGGAVRTADAVEAQVALFATRTALAARPNAFVVQGQVRWTDPTWEGAGLSLESSSVAYYGPLAGVEGGRAATGWMRIDQHPDEFPFLLLAVDAGAPGRGRERVALWVGDAAIEDPAFDDPVFADVPVPAAEPSGFRYRGDGMLVSGDLQLLSLAASALTGATPDATPAP
jgi:hypothetical protein